MCRYRQPGMFAAHLEAAEAQLDEPASAVHAAELLNQRPELVWRTGDPALHEPWMSYRGIVPFGEVHGTAPAN